ncbi:MAG: hypothetical protein ACREGL_04705, partial [Alphaproteobacteria bacterium]
MSSQMDPAEVLALEVRQYVGEGLKTFVPRLIGRKVTPPPKPPKWDEASFLQKLEAEKGGEVAAAARRILGWAEDNAIQIWWGKGNVYGAFGGTLTVQGTKRYSFTAYTDGKVYLKFTSPPFDKLDKRREYVTRLNDIPSVSIAMEGLRGERAVSLEGLASQNATDRFLSVLTWASSEIKKTDQYPA